MIPKVEDSNRAKRKFVIYVDVVTIVMGNRAILEFVIYE